MTKKIKYKFADLVDKLSVLQLKQIENTNQIIKFEKTINLLLKEINFTYLNKKNFYVDSKFIRLLVILTQINTYIWLIRDEIANSNKSLNKNMKISHQLNALRNIAKNELTLILSNKDKSAIRTNTNKEDLKGWVFSLINAK